MSTTAMSNKEEVVRVIRRRWMGENKVEELQEIFTMSWMKKYGVSGSWGKTIVWNGDWTGCSND